MVERPEVARPFSDEHKLASLALLKATLGIFQMSPASRQLATAVMQSYPKHAEQIQAAAIEVGVDPVDVAVANLSYDLFFGMMGCSTMALPTASGSVIARNMDWFPSDLIAKASVVIPTDNGRSAGFVGMVGVVTGLSNNGFGLALNAIHAGKLNIMGYPVLLFLRKVLDEAEDYFEAIHMVQSEDLMSGGIITVVGRVNNQRCVVERTQFQSRTRTAEDDTKPLVATNHYRVLAEPTECIRYDYMMQNAGYCEPFDVLCSQRVMQSITSQHVVVQPSTDTLKLYVPDYLLADRQPQTVMEMLQEMLQLI